MSLDTDHRKRHPCDVAEGIARERPRRIPAGVISDCPSLRDFLDLPVVVHEPGTYGHHWQHEVQAEEVTLDELLASIRHPRAPDSANLHLGFVSQQMQRYPEVERPREVEEIIEDDGKGDDEGLADFGAIDAR